MCFTNNSQRKRPADRRAVVKQPSLTEVLIRDKQLSSRGNAALTTNVPPITKATKLVPPSLTATLIKDRQKRSN